MIQSEKLCMDYVQIRLSLISLFFFFKSDFSCSEVHSNAKYFQALKLDFFCTDSQAQAKIQSNIPLVNLFLVYDADFYAAKMFNMSVLRRYYCYYTIFVASCSVSQSVSLQNNHIKCVYSLRRIVQSIGIDKITAFFNFFFIKVNERIV